MSQQGNILLFREKCSSASQTLSDQHAELDNEIRALGLEPPEYYKPGNTRLRRSDKPKKDGNLWLTENLEVAVITNHSTSEQTKWNATTGTDYNEADRAEQQRIREARAKAAKIERAAKDARAADTAAKIIQGAKQGADHQYAANKGVEIPYLTNGDNIVIPAYRDGHLATVQTITPSGEKMFIYGGSTKGIVHQIGDDAETIVVCEGWATGARIHQITGLTVAVTFSTGGLSQYKKPDTCNTLLIATDNDKSQAGEIAAAKLQQRYPDAVSILPPTIGTDWADYTADQVRHYWKPHQKTVIKQRYLDSDLFNQADHIAIRSETGTGKTEAFNRWMKTQSADLRVLYVVNSITLANNAAADLKGHGFVSYNDVEFYESVPLLVCCLDSVSKLEACKYDIVVMDESQQDVKALIKRKFTHDRVTTAGVLCMLLAKASKTIWLDADAGALTTIMAKQAGIELHWIHNEYQPLKDATVDVYQDFDKVVSLYESDQNQKYCFVSCKPDAEALHKRFKGTLVTADTADNKECKELLERFRSDDMMTTNIIATSTLGTGVSIEEHKHKIETVYLFLKLGDSLPDMLTAFQSSRRARGVMKFVVFMPERNAEPRSTDPHNIIDHHLEKQRKQSDDYILHMTRVDLTGRTFDPLIAGIFGQAIADRNEQLNDPLQFLISRFERAGATVTVHDGGTSKSSPARKQMRKSRDDLKAQRQAQCLTEDIPTLEQHKKGVRNPVKKALARAVHDLNLSDAAKDSGISDARQAAIREIQKPGYISRVKWGRRATESPETLTQSDIAKATTNQNRDPVSKSEAYRASLELEVLNLSGVLDQQWFDAAKMEEAIRPWLDKNAESYAIETNITNTGKRAAGFLVGVIERMGITVEKDKHQTAWRYRISTKDEPSRRTVKRLKHSAAGQISITIKEKTEIVSAA